MKCSQCGEENLEGASVCKKCGKSLLESQEEPNKIELLEESKEVFCDCGQKLEEDWKYCPYCSDELKIQNERYKRILLGRFTNSYLL